MRREMGVGVIHVDEPVYGGANGALKIAHDMPAEDRAERPARGRASRFTKPNAGAQQVPQLGSRGSRSRVRAAFLLSGAPNGDCEP